MRRSEDAKQNESATWIRSKVGRGVGRREMLNHSPSSRLVALGAEFAMHCVPLVLRELDVDDVVSGIVWARKPCKIARMIFF